MKIEVSICSAGMRKLTGVAFLAIAASATGWAQTTNLTVIRGTMNDYTPASTGGPYEVRGPWKLVVNQDSGKADFTAALTMERSDLGVMQSGGGDLNNPMDRMAHTHHITLTDGVVTTITGGIQVTGPGTVTFNGAFPPPFGSAIPTLTIQITGATGTSSITYSNISLLFGTPASGHFGTNPLHGAVTYAEDKELNPILELR